MDGAPSTDGDTRLSFVSVVSKKDHRVRSTADDVYVLGATGRIG